MHAAVLELIVQQVVDEPVALEQSAALELIRHHRHVEVGLGGAFGRAGVASVLVRDVLHLQQRGRQPLRELPLDQMLLRVLGGSRVACSRRHGGRVREESQDPQAMSAGRRHGLADEQHECGSVRCEYHCPFALRRSLSPR